jgi:phage/conjugal plasmid C-4 type zinc finger TraR family protein
MDSADHAQIIQEQSLSVALDAAQQASLSKPSVSALECEICGNPIPEKRRMAVQGCNTCIDCQQARERRENGYALAF